MLQTSQFLFSSRPPELRNDCRPLYKPVRTNSTIPTKGDVDEPTIGLHVDDIKELLTILQKLLDSGHTVVVVEHTVDVIKCADWNIDLGPESGAAGRQIVAEGRPEQVPLQRL